MNITVWGNYYSEIYKDCLRTWIKGTFLDLMKNSNESSIKFVSVPMEITDAFVFNDCNTLSELVNVN